MDRGKKMCTDLNCKVPTTYWARPAEVTNTSCDINRYMQWHMTCKYIIVLRITLSPYFSITIDIKTRLVMFLVIETNKSY